MVDRPDPHTPRRSTCGPSEQVRPRRHTPASVYIGLSWARTSRRGESGRTSPRPANGRLRRAAMCCEANRSGPTLRAGLVSRPRLGEAPELEKRWQRQVQRSSAHSSCRSWAHSLDGTAPRSQRVTWLTSSGRSWPPSTWQSAGQAGLQRSSRPCPRPSPGAWTTTRSG